jgi:hypothetical protein
MPKYRKKPVVVEAFQIVPGSTVRAPDWLREAAAKEPEEAGAYFLSDTYPREGMSGYSIRTLEGNHEVSWNDFIIQGGQGELYPCKPDIFEATYEEVGGDA